MSDRMAEARELFRRYDYLRPDDLATPIPDADLLAMEERCKRAQTGPWRVDFGEEIGNNWVVATGAAYDQERRGTYAVATDRIHASQTNAADGKDDAEFIAHARQDLPRCLEEIRRLRAELAKGWVRT